MTTEKTSQPIAPKCLHVLSCHGDERIDNYFWMHDRNDPQLIAYLQAENHYTDLMMQHTKGLQERLYDEMSDRIEEAELSVPYRQGEFYYYWRTEAGKNYPIFCRKQSSLDNREEVLLDCNELARGHRYFRLDLCEVSPNHQTLAYSIDTDGDENYTLCFLNLVEGDLYAQSIPGVCSFVWKNDSQTCFYTQVDATIRSDKLFRYTVGNPISDHILIYQEFDETFNVFVSKTRSQSYILMEVISLITSEIYYLENDDMNGKFKLIHSRSVEVRYKLEHHGDRFYILTNEEAINGKLMQTLVDSPSRENWQTLIPEREGVNLEEISAFADRLVIYEREAGVKKVRICQLSTGEEHWIEFPESVYEIKEDKNPEFNTENLRLEYKSLVTPDSIFEYNMSFRELTLKKQTTVSNGYDQTEYVSERIWAIAPDNETIPISLVYKRGIEKNGKAPLLLVGYGAYGVCEYISFCANRLSLLNRGVVFAIAHVRGGGEMGEKWHKDGKFLNKKNTFNDFIACAKYLVKNQWTSKEKLAIFGESAGGLLIGGVLNMHPNLCKIAIAKTPFVDPLTSILDTTLPMSVADWEEWGNPNNKIYYDYIKSYSPYDNVKQQEYPHLLITTGLNDANVPYWQPVKWTAKLREHKIDDNIVSLKINEGAGHRGASGRYEKLKEVAFEYAFLADKWGLS